MPYSATSHNHFGFFGKKEINSLYFTNGLYSFAKGLISVFVPIYFWELGFSIPRILFFYFLVSLAFVVLSSIVMPILRKMSDKLMMALSIPFLVVYFIGLGYIGDFPILFYILPLLASMNGILFNVGYHLDFSGSTHKGHEGSEVSKRNVISSLVRFASPFLGGVLITLFGFQYTFLVATIILILAIFPLFFFPKRKVSSHLNVSALYGFLTDKTLRPFNISCIGRALDTTITSVIWPLFIFFVIGSIEKFGAVISAGLLAGAVVTYFSGFLSDVGKRRKILRWSTIVYSFVWLARAFFNTIIPVITTDIAGRLAVAPIGVAWGSQYYKIARAIHAPSIFILNIEVAYNLVRVAFIPFLILLTYLFTQAHFFVAIFILAALTNLLVLTANRLHIYDLDDFIIEGEDEE